jgi:hypothetical protein
VSFSPGTPVCLFFFFSWVWAVGAPNVVAAPLSFSSSLSISEQYDSNIYLLQTDQFIECVPDLVEI